MVRFSDLIRGYAIISATGAEPARLLDKLTQRQIGFWSVTPEGDFTLKLCIRLKDVSRVLDLSEESRCDLELFNRRGAPLKIKQARRRYVLWLLPLAMFSLLVILSMFTWKIEIIGNEKVSDEEILNAMEDCGVFIGSFHPSYSSDSIRNRVMVKIPEIKWISVSVFGSRARILLRERTEIPEVYVKKEPVNVVAEYPGIIEQLRAFQGKPLFIRGQTVAKGDILISGAVPSMSESTIVCHAKGEVIARTWHEITVLMSIEYTEKVPTGEKDSRLALIFGNKRINFYSSSGITGAKCDNIIHEYKLGINGIFTFPISLICEQSLAYETYSARIDTALAKKVLSERAESELLRRIGEGGEVIKKSITFAETDGCLVATLRAECRQDIAEELPMTQAEIEQVRILNESLEENITQ